ncbi:MAG: DNA cytosine methyltransferase [Actinomycetota bacterium]|nr:DNA cytosine methyltransferase [Actinomycetota bacterium]
MTGPAEGATGGIPAKPAKRLSRRPVVVDLFAGAGGLSLGFEQAGFDILASLEYDPIHTAVHAFNFPQTKVICADVSVVGAGDVQSAIRDGWRAHGRREEWDGELDAVIGGPPCQGFSVIGRRSFGDTRNHLVFDFARVVGELQPRYFVMENVPGMTSLAVDETEDAPLLLDLLLERFDEYGYGVAEARVLNANEWGVPQDRKRLILLGTREGEPPLGYPKPETRPLSKRGMPEEPSPGSDPSAPTCPTVWNAIRDLPDLDNFSSSKFSDEIDLRPAQVRTMEQKASTYARILQGLDQDADDRSWRRAWDRAVLTSSLRTIHDPAVVARFKKTLPGHTELVSRLFRLHPKGVSSTLRAGSHYERGSFNAPRPIHQQRARVISVREAARLQSFPDWFRFHWTKWHGFRQVGNALPPRLGRAVAEEVVRALALNPPRPERVLDLGDPALLYLENIEAAERFDADPARMPRNELRRRGQPPRPKKVARAAA